MPVANNVHKTTTVKVKTYTPRKAVIRVAGTVPNGGGYGQTYPKGHKSTN